MFAIALSLKPSARACANESSRFGPMPPAEPTAASACQPAHFCWKSAFPFWTSADPETLPPVPQAASDNASAAQPSAAGSRRTLRRRLVGRLELRHGLVAGGIDGEDAVEARDLEDLGDVAVAADERQLPVIRAQALDSSDEDAERRGVDERRVAEVDDDLLAALADHLEQLLLELGGGVEVDLARERDHVGVVPELFCLDVEVHRPRLFPSARSLTLAAGLQCLDARPDLRLGARAEVELQEAPVRADGDGALVEGVRGLGEGEERLLILRLQLRDLLIRRDRPARRCLVLRDGRLVGRARPGGRRARQRVVRETQ